MSATAQAVSDAYSSKTKLADDLEQYLADAGKPVSATELGVDGTANVSGKSYIAEMENLESASQEFLNIMPPRRSSTQSPSGSSRSRPRRPEGGRQGRDQRRGRG